MNYIFDYIINESRHLGTLKFEYCQGLKALIGDRNFGILIDQFVNPSNYMHSLVKDNKTRETRFHRKVIQYFYHFDRALTTHLDNDDKWLFDIDLSVYDTEEKRILKQNGITKNIELLSYVDNPSIDHLHLKGCHKRYYQPLLLKFKRQLKGLKADGEQTKAHNLKLGNRLLLKLCNDTYLALHDLHTDQELLDHLCDLGITQTQIDLLYKDFIDIDTLNKLVWNCLKERERSILDANIINNQTLESIGSSASLTRERIRQIKKSSISKCRAFIDFILTNFKLYELTNLDYFLVPNQGLPFIFHRYKKDEFIYPYCLNEKNFFCNKDSTLVCNQQSFKFAKDIFEDDHLMMMAHSEDHLSQYLRNSCSKYIKQYGKVTIICRYTLVEKLSFTLAQFEPCQEGIPLDHIYKMYCQLFNKPNKKSTIQNILYKKPFIYFGRNSSFGLKEWENDFIRGGTIRDIAIEYLEKYPYPMPIVEVVKYIQKFRNTTYENIVSNINQDDHKRIIINDKKAYLKS